jgi:hypothetical protein
MTIVQKIRTRVDKWDCTKLENFCTAKEQVTRMKRQPIEREKIFARFSSDEGLITRIYKELKKLNSKRTNDSI